jgi:hypothetical protein
MNRGRKSLKAPKKGDGGPEDEEEEEEEFYEDNNLVKEVVCSAFVKEDRQDQYIDYPDSLLRVVFDEEYGPRIITKTDDDELLGDVLIGEMCDFSVSFLSSSYFMGFLLMLQAGDHFASLRLHTPENQIVTLLSRRGLGKNCYTRKRFYGTGVSSLGKMVSLVY